GLGRARRRQPLLPLTRRGRGPLPCPDGGRGPRRRSFRAWSVPPSPWRPRRRRRPLARSPSAPARQLDLQAPGLELRGPRPPRPERGVRLLLDRGRQAHRGRELLPTLRAVSVPRREPIYIDFRPNEDRKSVV